ncbi:MAG: hybrid sensor histidine kinase/response regulator [Sedimentisphaerales bacterium]
MPDKRDFIAIFKAETEDHLTKLNNGLVALEKHPENLELIKELNREAHTIKGSARVFGYLEIQEIAHRVEDIFDRVAQKKLVFSSIITDIVFKALDTIKVVLEKIVNEEKIDIDISEICKELENIFQDSADKKAVKEDKNQKSKEVKKPDGTEAVNLQSVTQIEEYIRVPVSKVDQLLNLVGEMVIRKMKSSQKSAQAKRLAKLAGEMQEKISDLNETIKTNPEDSEVMKLLAQCTGGIQKLKDESLNLYDNVLTENLHLEPVIDKLQDKMKAMRMLPCSIIFENFTRMVRDISLKQGKEVNLEISGGETELDKKVLEGIKSPLMHILRNCIDHGIEESTDRKKLGKPGFGTIKISAFHKGGNVIIEIKDDGRGMDIEEIKQTALKKRLVSGNDLEKMTEKEIKNIVFMNGYSTSQIITDVSGRGVGLDVVWHDIENLKGQVSFDTEKGKGTKFTLVLPLTIAIMQVLLIKCRDMLFAFPMGSIEEIIRVKPGDISTIEGKMAIQVRDNIIPVVSLDEVLGLPPKETTEKEQKTNETLSIVLTSSLDKQVGFIVDKVVGQEEIFIKNLGKHLGKVKKVSGATILGTGEVVVILYIADLITQSRLGCPAAADRTLTSKQKKKDRKILVVDDSLTTRELEKSILEAHGYVVDTAVDGLDAINNLNKDNFSLVISDIEMPKMDGFELCKILNNNVAYKDIPVVIVTALEKEEDKRRGIEAGAAAYIAKGAFNQTNLLDAVERLIG